MTYRTTEHKNAITRLVNSKRVILHKDLAQRVNRGDIKYVVDNLVNEGKFKKDKIKVRLKSGALMNQIVLYSNNTKYEEVLDFEREMINKPFESPLKENHCYTKVNPDKPKNNKRGRPKKVVADEVIEVNEIEVCDNNNHNDDNMVTNIIDNSIIPIYDMNGERIVNARELHDFLEVKSKFADWIKNKINKYKFIENQDFISVSKILENGGKSIDYLLKMDTAKEIAMIENNEKGRYIRKYFIDIEKKYKNQNNIQPTNSIDVLKHIVNVIEDLDKRTSNIEEKFKLLAN